jgi:hypothetical protein
MSPDKRKEQPIREATDEELKTQTPPEQERRAADDDNDPREEEGYFQPESSAVKNPGEPE